MARYRIYCEQDNDALGCVTYGYLTQACDELVDAYDGDVGEFTMDEVVAILPALDCDGCKLGHAQIERVEGDC